MEYPVITTPEELIRAVRKAGFLPFFSGPVSGFCIDDMVPREVWDADHGLGPWLWRDDIAREGSCLYGKFFSGKIGYVARDWFPHFANYRRNGYDFDALYDEGLAKTDDRKIYDLIAEHGPVTSPELRRLAGSPKRRSSRFESSMTRLQMMTYVIPSDFLFPRDKNGEKKFSFGTTVYDLPERVLGEDFVKSAYSADPAQSLVKITDHLMRLLPEAGEEAVLTFLR